MCASSERPSWLRTSAATVAPTWHSAVRRFVRMVDQATGKHEDEMRAFVRFVHDGVYLRLPDRAIHSLRVVAIGAHDDKHE